MTDRVAGRAAYHKGELALAESEYQSAIDTDPDKLPAWEGLANVQMAYGDTQAAAETYIRLVSPLVCTLCFSKAFTLPAVLRLACYQDLNAFLPGLPFNSTNCLF